MYDEVIIVSVVFASIIAIAIVIGIVIYFAKRLEHKQILAAIEKGIPPSKLRPTEPKSIGPKWIKYITQGIIVLAVAAAFAFGFVRFPFYRNSPAFFVAIILCGVGIALIIRGLLYRKYYTFGEQIQSPDKNNSRENS
jgi:sterol desaturase/sphingolipid hydroxylase (fatty acid hydroxylase superfamily)